MKFTEILSFLQSDGLLHDISIVGNPNIVVDSLNLCDRFTEKTSILTYATSGAYGELIINSSHIKAMIISADDIKTYKQIIEERKGVLLISSDPELDFYRIHEYLYNKTNFYNKFDFQTQIGSNCNIDKSSVIEKGVIIGNNVKIGPLTVIKKGSIIDDNTTIGCNTVIGSEGFQLITANNRPPMHITHVGKCHICSNVYIGDNTCVCNSLFDGETYIGSGAKIDNLVHIAHNLYVGKNAVITANVIACGSARIEEDAWIAPNVSILNRVTIGKGSKVGLGSVVTRDVAPGSVVYGNPAKSHKK